MKFTIVLAGCGYRDGAEIREAVLTLLAVEKHGHTFRCCAPDKMQRDVVDHLSGETAGASRNVRVEAARIARGEVDDLASVRAVDFDALVFPGGFGAAKNLCDFAEKGVDCRVDASVERLIRETHAAAKPIGAICIAPVIIARVLGKHRPVLTIGSDPSTAAALETMGATHREARAMEAVVDGKNRLVSTPAYMCAAAIPEIAAGIDRLVVEVAALAARMGT